MDVSLVLFVASFFVRRADTNDLLDGTPVLAMALAIAGVLVLIVGDGSAASSPTATECVWSTRLTSWTATFSPP